MRTRINKDTWPRREHFDFFNGFEEPFFGMTVRINCSKAYNAAKEKGHSFFLYYLHASIASVNETEAFRYRIGENDEVYLYDVIHPSATISRPDDTFGFCYMKFRGNFEEFCTSANREIEKVRNMKGLNPSGKDDKDVVHYSAIPWVDFQSLSHARSYSYKDSCPKISFGKLVREEGQYFMSMSVHVHHALIDGKHMGEYIERFQARMNGELT